MSKSSPGLTTPDQMNMAAPLTGRASAATLLVVTGAKSIQRLFDMEAGQDIACLKWQLHHRAKGTRNIWLVEGLNCDMVAVLGEHFQMDPSFFLDYERSSQWRLRPHEANLVPPLPSARNPRRLFCLPYSEVRELGAAFRGFVSCAETGRYVHQNSWHDSFIGTCTVDRRCCFWSRKTEEGGWDGK